ncbi:MAG: hypothetical protein K2Q22_15045, partial [Cytophagales bacterium]|nr:hypothetical protein [Cytophagales bacterium]
FNQYITQRALAAKDLKEAQHGVMLAGFLKLLMPLIVVVPGIVAFAILHHPLDGQVAMTGTIASKDEVYPWLLNTFLTPGIKGVVFAALVAAIVGSLSSKTNSIATIFAMDIYRPFWGSRKSDAHLVSVGRISIACSLIIAVLVAPYISLFKGGFQFIQVFTGFFSPGIFVIFLFGLFWRKASTGGALWVAGMTLPISTILYFLFGETSYSLIHLPFLFRMGISFFLLTAVMYFVSRQENATNDPKSISFQLDLFKTDNVFNIGAGIILGILLVLYTVFW